MLFIKLKPIKIAIKVYNDLKLQLKKLKSTKGRSKQTSNSGNISNGNYPDKKLVILMVTKKKNE